MKRFWAAVLAVALLLWGVPAQAHRASVAVNTTPGRMVCLTVDDGYGAMAIERVLKALRREGVHATFFLVGDALRANQKLWRQAVRDGNEICYHTMHHQDVSRMSDSAIRRDVRRWNKLAKKVLGKDYKIPKLVRLPGGSGNTSRRLGKLFHAMGYAVIGWSVDTYTGAIRKGASITRYIKRNTHKGSIVLTHFNTKDSKALKEYIHWLNRHYTLMTVSQALEEGEKDKITAATVPKSPDTADKPRLSHNLLLPLRPILV